MSVVTDYLLKLSGFIIIWCFCVICVVCIAPLWAIIIIIKCTVIIYESTIGMTEDKSSD